MPEFIPFKKSNSNTIRPANQPVAANHLGVATKKGLPKPKSPPGKYAKNMLQYPQNVTEGFSSGEDGHYILFHISTVDKAKIQESQLQAKRIAKSEEAIKAEQKRRDKVAASNPYNFDGDAVATSRKSAERSLAGSSAAGKQLVEGLKSDIAARHAAKDVTSLQVAQGRKRLESTIALYMPPTVNVQYQADWAEGEITARGRIAQAGLKALTGGLDKNAVKDVGGSDRIWC